MLRLYLAAVSAVVFANVIRASCVPNTQEAIEQTFSVFPPARRSPRVRSRNT